MIEIDVGEISDLLCRAVSHFTMKTIMENKDFTKLSVRGKNRTRDRDGNLNLEYYLPEGETEFIYQTIKIF